MSKLNAMRARHRDETANAVAPYKRLNNILRTNLQLETDRRAMMEKMIKNDLTEHIRKTLSTKLSDAFFAELSRAVRKALVDSDRYSETITVKVPTYVLHYMKPDDIANNIVKKWEDECLPDMRVRLGCEVLVDDSVKTIMITIPDLHLTHSFL